MFKAASYSPDNLVALARLKLTVPAMFFISASWKSSKSFASG